MKITLVRSASLTCQFDFGPDAAPPLGMAYIASVLLEAGHRVNIVDGIGEALDQFTKVDEMAGMFQRGLTDEQVVAMIPPDTELIGFSCMFSLEWPYTRRLIDYVKQNFPHVPIVAGGEHITACAEYILADCPAIEYCVYGEGEDTIVELIEALQSKREFNTIEGLIYRDKDKITRNPARKRIRTVEQLPRPAWHLTPIRNYFDKNVVSGVNIGRTMPLLASRGCPYQCTFCSSPQMWGTLWKAREPEDVLAEMKHYVKKYGASNFDFYDLTAIVKRDWIIKFANLIIENNLKVTWQLPSGTRSEAIDHEVSKLLYDSGCRFISYAPESGSVEVLKMIKKKVKKDRMLISLRAAVKNGLNIKTNIILGFPGETYKHVIETFGFIAQVALAGGHDLSVCYFSPYPGSELFNQLKNKNILRLSDEYFYSLNDYRGAGSKTRSYSEHISGSALKFLSLTGMMFFYSIQYALRPWRFFSLCKSLWQKKPNSRLTQSIIRNSEKRRTFDKQFDELASLKGA